MSLFNWREKASNHWTNFISGRHVTCGKAWNIYLILNLDITTNLCMQSIGIYFLGYSIKYLGNSVSYQNFYNFLGNLF